MKICFETLTSVGKRIRCQKNGDFKVVTQTDATKAKITPELAGKIELFRPLPEPIKVIP